MKKKIFKIIAGIVFTALIIQVDINASTPMEIRNAKEALKLPTAYGSHQGTHPSLVTLKKQWNGYKYWMAFTPYHNANAYYENPHIVASNNLIDWVMPEGIKNPVDAIYDVNKHNYNSDNHLIYNPDTNKLELIWRSVYGGKSVIYYMSSDDGVHWSEKKDILTLKRSPDDIYSPALVYENGLYRMWYVTTRYTVDYRESKDLKNWSKPRTIKLDFPDNMRPWHIDAKKIDDKYTLLINAFPFKGHVRSFHRYTGSNLYVMTSTDNLNYSKPEKILQPSSHGTIDDRGLYRSTISKTNKSYIIIYGGVATNKSWNIGLAMGKDLNSLVGYKQPGFDKVYKTFIKSTSSDQNNKKETISKYGFVNGEVKLVRERIYASKDKKILEYEKVLTYHANNQIKEIRSKELIDNKMHIRKEVYDEKGTLIRAMRK